MNSVEYIDVYRIEKNGRGPYNKSAGYSMYWNLPSPDKDADLPLMKDEDVWKYRFGSPSAESLIEWIKDAFKLSELGYKVSLYKAKKKYTHSSEIQTMFIKRHAKKVKEWSVEEFCKGNI